MKILRILPSLIAIVAISAISSIATADLVLYEFDFNTDGDTQGLIDFNNRLATGSYDATGGVLVGTGKDSQQNNDVQLRTVGGLLALDLGSLPDATLEIRIRNSTGEAINGGLSFRSFDGATAANVGGLPVSNFSFTPTAANTFEVFTVDAKTVLASVPNLNNGAIVNDNILRSFRLDPISTADTTFEIDYIRITTTAVPEPTSLAVLGLVTCGLLGRRRRS